MDNLLMLEVSHWDKKNFDDLIAATVKEHGEDVEISTKKTNHFSTSNILYTIKCSPMFAYWLGMAYGEAYREKQLLIASHKKRPGTGDDRIK